MRRASLLLSTSAALIAGLVWVSFAEARGGGPGAPRGGGMGRAPAGRGAAGRTAARAGSITRKNDNSEEAMKELEDRVALIAERRKRLADTEREANQEARLAAGRLDTAEIRTGEDVR